MPFVPFEDCVAVKIEGRIDSQMTLNTLNFRSSIGPRSAVDVQTLNVAIASWVEDNLAPQLNVGWTGVRCIAQGLTNANGLQAETSIAHVTGGITGEAMPNNVSMAVSFRTGSAGRSRRGRNFVPALSDSVVDGNNIDIDWATAVVNAYGELLFGAGVLPGGWIWVVLSRFTNGEPRVTGEFHEVFSVVLSDLIVDSMRSRLPGRGR